MMKKDAEDLRMLARRLVMECGDVHMKEVIAKDWSETLLEIAGRLEAGVNEPKAPSLPLLTYKVYTDPVTNKHLITATEVAASKTHPVDGFMKTLAEKAQNYWVTEFNRPEEVVGLKTDAAEPCICPPGGISRSCRAVGFRSGIMHKDRE